VLDKIKKHLKSVGDFVMTVLLGAYRLQV